MKLRVGAEEHERDPILEQLAREFAVDSLNLLDLRYPSSGLVTCSVENETHFLSWATTGDNTVVLINVLQSMS